MHTHHDAHDARDEIFIAGDILDQFYAPVQFDALTLLVSAYEATKARITEVHGLITQEHVSGVLGYFFNGNCTDRYGHNASLRHLNSFSEIFQLEGALNELTANYWDKALRQTDLMEYMPQARRSQWHTTLNAWREHTYKRGENPDLDLPEFNLANLRATVESLLARRAEFLAERVDGIFRGLSRSHVTNVPEGFSKRMILSRVYSEWGTADSHSEGLIHDLRLVIAKFMGRDDPCRRSTAELLKIARHERGQWLEADAGAFRIRAYKVGTAHLEVHPEMAYRLNGVLAYLYPSAIPESHRKRPARPTSGGFKSKSLFDRPLSNAVASALATMEPYYYLEKSTSFRREFDRITVRNSLCLRLSGPELSKHLLSEIHTVMESLGGVLTTCPKGRMTYWQFDFDPLDLVREVAVMGHLPDQRSHQFYPTPPEVAERLVEWLAIGPSDTCLEPSAGQGGIADLLPKDRTHCVEISPLHCDILRRKGHAVTEADFISWDMGVRYDAIAMNPPFSEGRWQAHLKHAASLLAEGGRLCAVLPLSARQQAESLLPGWQVECSEEIRGAFSGTSISVLLLRATRSA